MPFPFTLPTTSSFSFSGFVSSPTHPSLPLNASTQRGVLRATLKKHKRLPPSIQGAHLPSVVSAVASYIPYLLAIVDAGRLDGSAADVQIVNQTPLDIEWRPTLADPAIPGMKERPRVRIGTLEYEVYFVLSTLANAYTLMARSALHPLYDTSATFPEGQARTTAITTAGKHLRDAAEVYMCLSARAERYPPKLSPPCPDVAPPTMRALSSLALAEATLLAVLKDDPYPAVVAQERSKTDREWMYKAPSIPKVRAHLFARLCLGASEHAAEASSLCVAALGPAAGSVGGRISDTLVKYLEDLRRTSRAKACRFFGIDAELGGEMGTSLGWLGAALSELGVEVDAAGSRKSGSSLSFGRFKKEWIEKREEKRIEKETTWGMDAGRLEETRVVEMLHAKWSKINDTINTQKIPPLGQVIAQMPSGRNMYSLQDYQPPLLEASQLESFRAPPDRVDDYGHADSSDEDANAGGHPLVVTGAFPGPQSSGRACY